MKSGAPSGFLCSGAPDSFLFSMLTANSDYLGRLLSKEGQARSAGVVCSKPRSHLTDAREALLINRYCSALNRPPQPSLCEGIPALLRRGMALTLFGQQARQPVAKMCRRSPTLIRCASRDILDST